MRMAKQALAEGKCVVIGLQSTGEARTADVIAERGEELDDFVSGPKVGLQNAVDMLTGQAQNLITSDGIAEDAGGTRETAQ